MTQLYTTIKDQSGKEYIVPKSDKDTASAIRRIAELKIKAHGLDCTPEQYFERCTAMKERKALDREAMC